MVQLSKELSIAHSILDKWKKEFKSPRPFKKRTFALITLKDNGPGIPDEVIKNLGKLGNTYNKVGGSGLGLFYLHETILSLNGEYSIRNYSDGAEINLKIPLTA